MRIRSLIVAAALVAAPALAAVASPSYAATPDAPAPVCATWKAEGATGAYPAVTFGGKPAGTVIGESTAKLVKPTEGVSPGVQFAAKDVGVEAPEGGTTVTVSYELSDGASSSAGAVRLFGYDTPGADVLLDAPDWQDIASGDSGTLTLTVPAGEQIAVLGLVYDASNDKQGAVTFSGMKIGERPVSFTTCPEPEPTDTATPDPSGSSSPSPSGSATPSATSSSSPATTDPGGSAGTDDGLPVTGPGVGVIVGLGVMLALVGAVAVMATRRGRKFEA